MQRAFVLHRWPWQEHGLLLDVLTEQDGRVRVVSKYARSRKSTLRATLQSFNLMTLDIIGRGEVKTLRRAELEQSFPLQGERVYSGLYMNELVQRLVREQLEVAGLFDAYHQALTLLHQDVDEALLLRRFEWQLLQSLELLDSFSHEARAGEPIQPDAVYTYVAGTGFLEIPEVAVDRLCMRGDDILAMAQFDIGTPQRYRLFRQVMRAALEPHLGNKPLQSRALRIAAQGAKLGKPLA
ncbi:DNA repair protein RecO [Aliidiomarina halalkaliphila]|uniref:DNA repair protein RecO n=1 Tax=Aliidiomarina halalkaliphila TaxID=2593535 RepID=A0A552X3L2_9GAMM|nr:DNA repair protein RecO [Aliidiomarina halalkaliphila]TRW49602.1 DNA repair protein RecO [Aliidiomarina halalkaliphila]